MFNFFIDESFKNGNCYQIDGADFHHIKNVLRMKKGDSFLVSNNATGNLCKITEIYEDYLIAEIVEENYRNSEPDVEIYLFQGLPKNDKMELIIQKCVELGVHCIVPTEMARCVVKLDDKKKKSKLTRWQAISESAAKQSKRNLIPTVNDVVTYNQALEIANELDLILLPYESEDGMLGTKTALKKIKSGTKIGIFIFVETSLRSNENSYFCTAFNLFKSGFCT